MKLSDAQAIYIGGTQVTKIYAGLQEVFSGAVGEVRAILMGQSEIEHIFNPAAFYDMTPVPDVTGTNMIVIRQSGTGAAPVEHEVTNANIAAGLVSDAMGSLACYLRDICGPSVRFIIGDGAVPGTGRTQLADDADGARLFSDFVSVVDHIETNYGTVNHLIECWYNSDSSRIPNFKDNFWPFYFGVNPNGSTFTLGTSYSAPGGSYVVDHCLWDADATSDQKGRGIFTKSDTQWNILTPMPFSDAPTSPDPEAAQFTQGNRLDEPDRQVMIDLAGEPEAVSVNCTVGPSAHLCNFDGDIHPAENTDPDGKGLFAMAFAAPIATAAGTAVSEPAIQSVTGPTDGSYADIVVSLPNGGNLTTLRELRGESLPVTPSPHQQDVTGFEIFRIGEGSRRPVFNTTETSYPVSFRGTVAIQDSGSGDPRTGTVRITPENNFVFSDSLSYLRGQATAMLIKPRDVDNRLYRDFLIEHIPGYYNNSNDYSYEGVPVRPLQSDFSVNVPAPAFQARAVSADGSDALFGTPNVAMGAQGMASFWFKNTDTAWNQLRFIFEHGDGSARILMRTTSNDRIQFGLHDNSVLSTYSFYSDGSSSPFVINEWYHIMISWDASDIIVYVNNVEALNFPSNGVWTGTLNQIGFIGDRIGRVNSAGTCDIGHVWLSTTQIIDITQSANRQKFAIAGQPVDLGGNGETPTGTAPEFYLDGAGAAFNNVGTAGGLTLVGSFDDAPDAPEYTP